jgi:hypothetical protein
LEFTDGAPSPQTLAKVYDHLDFPNGVNVYLTANADTVCYVGIVDLTNGPMVVQTPRGAQTGKEP